MSAPRQNGLFEMPAVVQGRAVAALIYACHRSLFSVGHGDAKAAQDLTALRAAVADVRASSAPTLAALVKVTGYFLDDPHTLAATLRRVLDVATHGNAAAQAAMVDEVLG